MGSVLFGFLKSYCQGSFRVYKKLSKMKIKIYQIHYDFCMQQENFKRSRFFQCATTAGVTTNVVNVDIFTLKVDVWNQKGGIE